MTDVDKPGGEPVAAEPLASGELFGSGPAFMFSFEESKLKPVSSRRKLARPPSSAIRKCTRKCMRKSGQNKDQPWPSSPSVCCAILRRTRDNNTKLTEMATPTPTPTPAREEQRASDNRLDCSLKEESLVAAQSVLEVAFVKSESMFKSIKSEIDGPQSSNDSSIESDDDEIHTEHCRPVVGGYYCDRRQFDCRKCCCFNAFLNERENQALRGDEERDNQASEWGQQPPLRLQRRPVAAAADVCSPRALMAASATTTTTTTTTTTKTTTATMASSDSADQKPASGWQQSTATSAKHPSSMKTPTSIASITTTAATTASSSEEPSRRARQRGRAREERRRRATTAMTRKHFQSWNTLGGRHSVMIRLLLLAAINTLLAPLFAPGPTGATRGQLLASAQVLKASGGNQQAAATNSPSSSSSSNTGCPYPAVNPNCQVNIIAQAPAVPLLNTEFVADEYSTLKPDTQAAYKCDHGYELLGSEQVTCLASGRWSAPAPNCVTNIAPGKPTNQSSTIRGGESRNANDGKLITQHDAKFCTETKVDQSPWWQIDLLQVYEIRSIRILGRACCNPHLSLHDIEIRVGNSSTLQGNRLCAWYPNNLDEGTSKDFQCAHPILGRFVSIQMVGIESALSLCEVMVFSTKEFHPDRCGIQSTLAPSGQRVATQSSVITTTSATTTQLTNQQNSGSGVNQDNQIIVFNRTCYETQATSGGSFLVADTYCKARGGSLLHSVNDLTQNFISQELERMKSKLKSKLVWLGAKRENASPNAQGPITQGSTSALLPFASDRSLSASLHEFPIESLFSNDHGLISSGETSSIFSPAIKLSRSALLQASSGAGGSTSRGSQTFGLPSSNHHHHHHHHHPSNGSSSSSSSTGHTGRSLIISQPSQVSSFFTPPVTTSSNSLSSSGSSLSPTLVSPNLAATSPISFASPNTHVHRTLRPPSLVSTQAPAASVPSSWNPSRLLVDSSSTSSINTAPQLSPASSMWRWVGDAASDTLQSPVTNFLWADDQPNNYNNQQDCIVLDGGKKWLWNDVTCELDYLPWVCQYRPSTCGSPDRQENSTILELATTSYEDGSSEAAFKLGKTITYACPVGHRLDGPRTRRCLYDGSWSGRAPKCQYVNCGSIGSQTMENGRVVHLNQSQTTFGSQVKYVCYEDYVLVGDDTRQCQADGKWAGKQPFCAYKWCPQLQTISNGQLNVSSFSENSIATYQCNSGYKLIGNDTRQCLLGGKWTNQEPFCQYVDCGQPKQIPNGSHQLINGTTNYLSVVEYTCNENYTLAGNNNNNKMVCSHNNRWTGREPQCTLIDCGQPLANAGSRFSGSSFTVHSSIEYRCDPGFKEVSGNSQRTCGLDGQWSGQPLVCKYVDCGRVPAILKGEVSYINGTTYLASQIAYECTPGNRIAGHRVRFCGPDGRWTGGSPKCEEVRCDAPELPANGSAIYIGNDRSFKEQSFSVGVTVQYECDYGHVVKGSWSSRLCQANGEWSGEPPVCKFVDCGQAPPIENGNYLLKHPPAGASIGTATPIELSRRSDGGNSGAGAVGTFTYYGTIAHYSCEPNYKLQGPAQRECLESGQWRTPLPTCEPIQCPKPEFFDEHTQVSLVQKWGISGDAGAENNQQQQLKAIKLIANNQWLSSSHQHQVNNLTYNVGDKLLYSCVPGFELYGGPEVRTCTQYAQWSGSSTPRCRLIDCGRPAPIGQEGRYYLLNESTTFNSLVEYSCVRPFKLVEVKIRQAGNLIETLMNAQAGVTQILTSLPIGVKVCANNGQWMPNDQQPKCTTGAGGGIGAISGQFDGVDNTLDGGARQVHGTSLNAASGSAGSGHPSFININGAAGAGGNQDVDSNNLDGASSSGQQATGSQSAYFWAKVLLVISLPLMFAIITVTLICIKSKKPPKQASATMHRASILTSSGQRAAAAAAAMQIQLANSKGLQQTPVQLSVAATHANGHNHHHNHQHQHQVAGMMPGQNVYVGAHNNGTAGMQKMFSGSMVGQSQMSSNGIQSAYGADAVLALGGQDGGPARSMVAFTGPMLMNGKSSSLGMTVGSNQRATRADHHHPGLDSYSRLSIESEANNQAAGNKTIRHNPNGLVTFVSPAQQQHHQQQKAQQQQQQQQQQQKGANSGQLQQQQVSSSASTSSTSSGVSSSSHHHPHHRHAHNQHQISPQSISTSLSVSSSSSPSSSNSSSAHHTTATRLAGDSSSSPSNSIQDGVVGGLRNHQQQQQQNHHHQLQGEYEAPQQLNQQVPVQPPANPPSLPAHPPPPHRVQQQFKQLMKHQSTASPTATATTSSSKQAARGVSSASSSSSSSASDVASKQQAAILAQTGKSGAPLNGDHHYMEPGV